MEAFSPTVTPRFSDRWAGILSTNPLSAWPVHPMVTATGKWLPTAVCSRSVTPHFTGLWAGILYNQPIVAIASTADGRGYWLVASDGGIFSFGDAVFFGSTGAITLNSPIVGMAATHDGKGYWLVASDGGIFTFGDARFFGSTGNQGLPFPIAGMAATADGGGYWLTDTQGGIYNFGDAQNDGSRSFQDYTYPVVGMAGDPNGGFWEVAYDGTVGNFGAPSFGSAGGNGVALPPQPPNNPGATAANAALSQVGVPSVYDGESPGVGFDASGLTQWAWAKAGVSIPRTMTGQLAFGTPIPLADIQPGDLIISAFMGDGDSNPSTSVMARWCQRCSPGDRGSDATVYVRNSRDQATLKKQHLTIRHRPLNRDHFFR